MEEQNKKSKAPKLPRKKRWLSVLVVVLVIAGIAAAGILGARQKLNTKIGGSYLVDQVTRQDLVLSVSESAVLEPADSAEVTTMLSGDIRQAPFEEWEQVQQGELLYQFDSGDVQSSIDRAAISVEQAELNYQRAQESLHPTAPISGTIREVMVHNGDSVQPGMPLAQLTRDMEIYADLLFPYAEPSFFYPGQPVTLYINGMAGTTPGTVSQVSNDTVVAADSRICASVRVKVTNPGVLSDHLTCSAVIGNYCSLENTPLSMAGNTVVYASAAGTVREFSKLAGSTVKAGEVLCTIDSDQTRDQLENARLGLESAQLAQSSSADALNDFRITAPISGTVIAKNFQTGDKVEGAASGSLATIYDLSCLKLEMGVHELDIGKVKLGQQVRITADALEGQEFMGVVDKIGINGTNAGGATSYPVTVILREYGELRPGMTASASILGDELKDALCIPVDAVSRGNEVLVPGPGAMSEDGTIVVDPSKLETRVVKLGRSDDMFIEVLEGLEEGETVLTVNEASSMMDMMMGAY